MTQLSRYMLYFFLWPATECPGFEGRQDGCGCLTNMLLFQMEEISENATERQNIYKKYEMRESCDTEQIDKINKFGPLPPLRSHYKSLNSLNCVPEFPQPGGRIEVTQKAYIKQ